MYYPLSRYKCPHISPQIFNNTEKKKDERNMNDSLILPTQFPDEEVEGRSSCTSSPSPASLGTAALTLQARPLGTAPCHLLEHCTLPPPGASIREREAPDAGESGEPWTGARGPLSKARRPQRHDALQAVGMSSPRAGVSVGTDLLLTQH